MNARDDSGQLLKHASGYHAPVLWNDVIQTLVTDSVGTYVDGTLGGGGHTEALLQALAPEGRVFAIDRDDDALKAAGERLVMVAVGEVLTATWAERAGVDIVGVGDSLGMTLYGHENTLAMTVDPPVLLQLQQFHKPN